MRKILIIDGDHDFTRMVVPFLESAHFEVAGANNLEEARSELERFRPDLVLLSRDLIGESGNLIPDGLGLLKEMKTRRDWKKIPVVFLVSGAGEDDLEKLRRLKYKAEDYARKPLEDNDLLRRIENLTGFDPEETDTRLRSELAKLSGRESSAASGGQDLKAVADQELQALFTRLGAELPAAEAEPELDFADNVEELSPEQLRNELEFVKARVQEREGHQQALQEKFRKALELLKERIMRLEREQRRLAEELEAVRVDRENLAMENAERKELLEAAGDLLEGLEKLADKFGRNLEAVRDWKRRVGRVRSRRGGD